MRAEKPATQSSLTRIALRAASDRPSLPAAAGDGQQIVKINRAGTEFERLGHWHPFLVRLPRPRRRNRSVVRPKPCQRRRARHRYRAAVPVVMRTPSRAKQRAAIPAPARCALSASASGADRQPDEIRRRLRHRQAKGRNPIGQPRAFGGVPVHPCGHRVGSVSAASAAAKATPGSGKGGATAWIAAMISGAATHSRRAARPGPMPWKRCAGSPDSDAAPAGVPVPPTRVSARAVIIAIGLVQNDQHIGGQRGQQPVQRLGRKRGAGGIVGVADQHGPGCAARPRPDIAAASRRCSPSSGTSTSRAPARPAMIG